MRNLALQLFAAGLILTIVVAYQLLAESNRKLANDIDRLEAAIAAETEHGEALQGQITALSEAVER